LRRGKLLRGDRSRQPKREHKPEELVHENLPHFIVLSVTGLFYDTLHTGTRHQMHLGIRICTYPFG